MAFTAILEIASLLDAFLPLSRVLGRVSLGSGAQIYSVGVLLLGLRRGGRGCRGGRGGRGGRDGRGGARLIGGSGLQASEIIIVLINKISAVLKLYRKNYFY